MGYKISVNILNYNKISKGLRIRCIMLILDILHDKTKSTAAFACIEVVSKRGTENLISPISIQISVQPKITPSAPEDIKSSTTWIYFF